jgi:hypothetical protein
MSISASDKYPRKKASCIRAGFDPDMREHRRLCAIRSNQEKKAQRAVVAYEKACRSVDYYWERTFAAIDEKEESDYEESA